MRAFEMRRPNAAARVTMHAEATRNPGGCACCLCFAPLFFFFRVMINAYRAMRCVDAMFDAQSVQAINTPIPPAMFCHTRYAARRELFTFTFMPFCPAIFFFFFFFFPRCTLVYFICRYKELRATRFAPAGFMICPTSQDDDAPRKSAADMAPRYARAGAVPQRVHVPVTLPRRRVAKSVYSMFHQRRVRDARCGARYHSPVMMRLRSRARRASVRGPAAHYARASVVCRRGFDGVKAPCRDIRFND